MTRKCERLVPISSHEPSLRTRNRKLTTIASDTKRAARNVLCASAPVTSSTARNAHDAYTNGTSVLSNTSAAITNGLKTVTNALAHIGSNELRLAVPPEPKKPSSTAATKAKTLGNGDSSPIVPLTPRRPNSWMSEVTGKLPKPQTRRLLNSAIRRNLVFVGVSVVIAGSYMKFVWGDGNKKAYADFYRTYDGEKEFELMRKKGLFDSCDADD